MDEKNTTNEINSFGSTNKFEELKQLVTPVVDFLRTNYDPHCRIVISFDYITIVQTIQGMPFIK